MRARLYGLSDVGKRREKNEDSFLINEELGFCIVADGMGGHLGGERASKLAVSTIEEVIRMLHHDPETTLGEGKDVRGDECERYLRHAISEASSRIYEKAKHEAALRGMGTTAVVAFVRGDRIYIAHVGDSRAYFIRDRKIIQVTQDHSLVGEQIRAGFLSVNDARSHRLKNVITRSVGFQETVDADVSVRKAKVGDRYVLCTDGLSNLVDDVEIRDIVVHSEAHQACQRLIDIANERGGDDNITVVLIHLQASNGDTPAHDPSEATTIEED